MARPDGHQIISGPGPDAPDGSGARILFRPGRDRTGALRQLGCCGQASVPPASIQPSAVELEIDGVAVEIARGAGAHVIAAAIEALKRAR
jgi:hypothetical protein